MAFETAIFDDYTQLFDRVRAALTSVKFMGYDLVVGTITGTFQLGETVHTGTGSFVLRSGFETTLVVDTGTGATPTLSAGQTLTGDTSGATATITTATDRAWDEEYYDAAGSVAGVDKRLVLKNYGQTGPLMGGGQDEVWLTLQQYTGGAAGPGTAAGMIFGGATGYESLPGGWAGYTHVASNSSSDGGFLPMAHTGLLAKDQLKYWLVADRQRVILAVHLQVAVGGGMVLWAHAGLLTRWDPPSQYPLPLLIGAPAGSPQVYTTYLDSLGYGGSQWCVHPIAQQVCQSFSITSQVPAIANPDGSHTLLPFWCHGQLYGGYNYYLGEVEGMFYVDPGVALGDTATIGGVDYVMLQDYTPGKYIALRLW